MNFKEFRREYNNIAANYFKVKDFNVLDKYPYILRNREDWSLNILSPVIYNYILEKKSEAMVNGEPFPLHKYLHHGLSSQAMLFNLFGEAVICKDIRLFKDIFNFEDLVLNDSSEIKFEHFLRKTFNENQSQPTSFDLAIINEKGKNIFLEAKLVETEFGGCSCIKDGECDGLNPIGKNERCYLTNKGRNYWEIMESENLSKPYEDSPICPFVVYYQFYREIMFAEKNNGYFVMLVDKRNPAFLKISNGEERGLIPLLRDRLPEKYKKIFKVLFIQDVVKCLEDSGWKLVNEFKSKYGIV